MEQEKTKTPHGNVGKKNLSATSRVQLMLPIPRTPPPNATYRCGILLPKNLRPRKGWQGQDLGAPCDGSPGTIHTTCVILMGFHGIS